MPEGIFPFFDLMKPSVEQMTSLTPLQKEIEVKRRVKEKLKKYIVIDEVRA